MWKKTIRNSAIIFSGIFISRLFIFLYRILLVRELSVQEYAIFALMTTIFTWILIFSHFDLYAGVSKYVSESMQNKDIGRAWQYYTNAVIIGMGLSIAGLIIGMLVSIPYNISPIIACIFFAGLIPFAITNINDGLLKGSGNFGAASSISSSIGISRFLVLGLFVTVFTSLNVNKALMLFALALLIPFGLSMLQAKILKRNHDIDLGSYNNKITRELFHYSKWVTLTDLLNSGIILYSTFLLSLYSLNDLALFNVVFVFYSVFQMGFASITTVLIPQISRQAAQGEAIRLLGKRHFIYLVFLTVIIIIAIIQFPHKERLLTIILGKSEYANSFSYLAVLLTAIPFRLLTMTNKGIVQGLGNTRSIAMIALASFIINAILLIPMYRSFGLYGAMISIVLAFMIEFILTFVSANRAVSVHNGCGLVEALK